MLADGLSTLWSHRGLDRTSYERRMDHERAVWGDEVPMTLTARNAKALPLPWFRVDDLVTEGLTVRDRPLIPSDLPGRSILRTTWTMRPFERATRWVHLVADRRGVFDFGPVRLSVADLFGRDAATEERATDGTLLVRPRSVPVRALGGWREPLGTRRARSAALFEDPSLFAGVRPYQQGDSPRRIHHRATARSVRPLSKRFDPSTVRTIVVALDVQTNDGPTWLLAYDEDLLESLVVSAVSLCRRFLESGAAVGLAANGWSRSLSRTAFVPPRSGLRHLTAVSDCLARLSPTASVPIGHLLATLPVRVAPGTMVVLVSSRDPVLIAPEARRLAVVGYELRLVTLGSRADEWRRRASRIGVPARIGRLDPDWRTGASLELAG
jgi:uncharacterized protein (DUF58 family)